MAAKILAGPRGFEPRTSGSAGLRVRVERFIWVRVTMKLGKTQ